MGPRKGRKKFFQPSEEEKAVFELARIESKLKKKQQQRHWAEKLQQEADLQKKTLLEERKRFLTELAANPSKKDLFEPNITKKLLVYTFPKLPFLLHSLTSFITRLKNPGKVSPGLMNQFAALNIVSKETIKVSKPQEAGEHEMQEEKEVWGLKMIREEEH